MRVYLAGKISKGDWREDVIGRRTSVDYGDASLLWDEVPIIGTSHVCVGPWFIACDHGCAHGPDQHGQGFDSNCFGSHYALARAEAVSRCLDAIRRCDVFFAWLEPTAYGTVAELGYAKALGKQVIVGAVASASDVVAVREHGGECIDDLWFARSMSDRVIVAPDASTAIASALASLSNLSRAACESPIELLFFDQISDRNLYGFVAWNQYDTDGYRLDFAFLHPDGRKICVEVDGHEFHERTKEQAEHDRSRDRRLTAAGWDVLRFTGREIHRDAKHCADECAAMMGRGR